MTFTCRPVRRPKCRQATCRSRLSRYTSGVVKRSPVGTVEAEKERIGRGHLWLGELRRASRAPPRPINRSRPLDGQGLAPAAFAGGGAARGGCLGGRGTAATGGSRVFDECAFLVHDVPLFEEVLPVELAGLFVAGEEVEGEAGVGDLPSAMGDRDRPQQRGARAAGRGRLRCTSHDEGRPILVADRVGGAAVHMLAVLRVAIERLAS